MPLGKPDNRRFSDQNAAKNCSHRRCMPTRFVACLRIQETIRTIQVQQNLFLEDVEKTHERS